MKKMLALILTLSLFACLCTQPALAESAREGASTVTALGTATVTLKPDKATFSVGVSAEDAQVTVAQTANAAVMQKLLDSLKALGVADDDLQTDNYSVSPLYDYQSGKLGDQQILKGYTVSNTVTVTVRQLDQLSQLLDASVAAGANQMYGVTFQSTQNDAAYDQALAAATKDAVRKAGLMATALGRTAGSVLSAEEVTDSYSVYSSAKSVAYDVAVATPIEVGTLSVTTSVRVVVAVE